MSCDKLFSKIEELYPLYVKVWEDICNIESPTTYKAGVDAVNDYFIKLAEERGWDVEVCHQEVSGDAVCITMNPDAKGAPVCLSGHTDTVHPVGLFPTPAVRIEDGKIYGPGVIDCKGGCVASFLAMDALRQIGYIERPVKLILQSDEENSSKTSDKKTIEFMCEKSKGAAFFLNTEGRNVKTSYDVVLQRKGIWRIEFHVEGVAAHSSRCYEGANAILEASHKIIELEKFKDAEGITCNCGVIKGGTVGNTVPEKCSFIADFRYPTQKEADEIRSVLDNLCSDIKTEGCRCEWETVSSRPPMELVERNVKLFERMNEVFNQIGLGVLGHKKTGGGSDASYITLEGIPCVDCIGVAGDKIHSKDEFAVLDSLKDSAKRIATAIMYL